MSLNLIKQENDLSKDEIVFLLRIILNHLRLPGVYKRFTHFILF